MELDLSLQVQSHTAASVDYFHLSLTLLSMVKQQEIMKTGQIIEGREQNREAKLRRMGARTLHKQICCQFLYCAP